MIRKGRCVRARGRPCRGESARLGPADGSRARAGSSRCRAPPPAPPSARDHRGPPRGRTPGRQLTLAADQPRLAAPPRGRSGKSALEPPRLDRLGAALEGHGLARDEAERLVRQPAGRAADQDLVRLRALLQAGGDVHRIAADAVVALLRAARPTDHLAGVDADADLQLVIQRRLRPRESRGPRGARAPRRRRAPPGRRTAPSRRRRCTSRRCRRIARPRPPPRRNTRAEARGLLRIARLGATGEAHEVGEQHRHQPALVGNRHASILRRRRAPRADRTPRGKPASQSDTEFGTSGLVARAITAGSVDRWSSWTASRSGSCQPAWP